MAQIKHYFYQIIETGERLVISHDDYYKKDACNQWLSTYMFYPGYLKLYQDKGIVERGKWCPIYDMGKPGYVWTYMTSYLPIARRSSFNIDLSRDENVEPMERLAGKPIIPISIYDIQSIEPFIRK